MSDAPGPMRPLSFDLSEMVRRSVATLYSHLVTRPTGQALRLGIESQIGEVGPPCVSILDFNQVVVMDYSCADEAVAKLLQRYARDGADEVYFFARGVGDRHVDTIDAVLLRHGLALVAQFDDEAVELLGPVTARELRVWQAVQDRSRACARDMAPDLDSSEDDVTATLEGLSRRRLVARLAGPGPTTYAALSSIVPGPSSP